MKAPSFSPVSPENRDPKLVFVGLACTGDPLFELAQMMNALEMGENADGWKFVCRRVTNQGVGKGRNLLIHMARCLGASQFVSLDHDIGASPGHIFKLLRHKEEFVSAAYPKRETPLNWVAEMDPQEDGKVPELWPCTSVGMGLLKVSMTAVDAMVRRWPELEYESEENHPAWNLRPGQRIHALCHDGVVEDVWRGRVFSRFLTEDYMLCWRHRKAGGEIFMDTKCQAGHVGRIDYLRLEAILENERIKAQLAAKEEFKAASAAADV